MRTCLCALFLTCFSILSSSATSYYSQGSLDPTLLSSWNTVRAGGGSAPADFATANDQFFIQSGHLMTNGGLWNLSGINMRLEIENGGTLQANAIVDVVPSFTFQVTSGGRFNHNFASAEINDGTTIYATGSTVELQKIPASTYNVLDFGNLILNYTTGGNMRFNVGASGTLTINNDLTITNTGAGSDEVRVATSASTNATLRVNGNFTLNGGTFDFYSASSTGGRIEVGGDFLFTGGTWDNTGSDNLTVEFTGAAPANFSVNGVTYAGAAEDDTNWVISSGKAVTQLSNWPVGANRSLVVNGRLNTEAFTVIDEGINSTFTLPSGGTLSIGSPVGLSSSGSSGSVQTQVRNLSPAATYIYGGTAAQVTGNGLFDEINPLTGRLLISNISNTVTLSESVTVGDGFILTIDANAKLLIPSTLFIRNSIGSATANINGTLQSQEDDGFSTSAITGSFTFQGFDVFNYGTNGTVEFNRGGSRQFLTSQFAYNNVIISNGGATNEFTDTLDVDGNLTVTNGSTLLGNSSRIDLGGNFTINPGSNFTQGTSTVNFNGAATQVVDTDGAETFYNLMINVSGTVIFSDGVTIAPSGSLTITSGIMNMGTNPLVGVQASGTRTLTMSGGRLILGEATTTSQPDFSNFNLTGGTLELASSGNQTLNGGKTYFNLAFTGNGNKNISSATADINGTVTINCACSVDVSNSTFGDAGTALTMTNGTFRIDGGGTKPDISGTYNLTGGTIEFYGTTAKSIRSPITYYNVLVTGTNVSGGAGNYTLRNGGNFRVSSGGIFSVTNQRIVFSPPGTASVTINGTFNTSDNDGFSGSTATSIGSSISTVTLGSSSIINYNSASGTQQVTPRSDYANLTLSGAALKSMTGAFSISRNFAAAGGAVTTPTSINFNGSSAQAIAGLDYGTSNITLFNGGTKSLSGPGTIGGEITFANGKLSLGAFDLTLPASATVSSANGSSFLRTDGTGTVLRPISSGQSLDFPVGIGSFIPLTLAVDAGTGGTFGVAVADGISNQPDGGGGARTDDAVLKSWMVSTPASGANDVTTTLQWNNTDQVPNPGLTNASNNVVVGFASTSASDFDNGPGQVAANPSSGIFTATRSANLAPSNEFRFGVADENRPLPVTLLYFKARKAGEVIVLDWETAMEENNSHFEVLRSTDGLDWLSIGRTYASGLSDGSAYTMEDRTVDFNSQLKIYYKLKQVDLDGTESYFEAVVVETNLSQITAIAIYGENGVTLQVNGDRTELMLSEIRILNSLGQIIRPNLNTSNNAMVIPNSELSQGVYFAQFPSSTGIKPLKFIVR